MNSILIASVRANTADIIRKSFKSAQQIDHVSSIETCLKKYAQNKYDFLFIDIDLIKQLNSALHDYRERLQHLWKLNPDTELVVLSEPDQIRETVRAVKAGASDYLIYPLDPAEVKHIAENIINSIRIQSELNYLRGQMFQRNAFLMLQTEADIVKKVFENVRAVAPTNSTVLLSGETGTGKGVIAKLIHQHSQRSERQFIHVHCGAIPETLIESELFGHEKGAFTGAIRQNLGKFEIANGGTLFLDEIGTISPSIQIKLLQVLQEKTFQRVGGEVDISTDIRIIAATNIDLEKLCNEGTFRYDLFYRLNVFPITIPSLRERIQDIPQFIELFLKRLNKFSSKEINDVHPDVLSAFEAYNWPGNIRELENLIERAYILETSSMLSPGSFPVSLFKDRSPAYLYKIDTSKTLGEVRQQQIEKIEKQYLNDLLLKNKGKINDTAKAAGVGVRQLHKLLTKHNIQKKDYKILNNRHSKTGI